VPPLEAELRSNAESAACFELLGRAYAGSRQHGRAVIAFERASKLEPQRTDLQLKLAEVATLSGNHALAAVALRRAGDIEPENITILRKLSSAELALGRPALAVELLERALALAPTDARVRFDLAAVHVQQRRRDLAEHHYGALSQLDPELAARLALLLRT
jgi:Flp pilus assembly protein TadD